MMVTTYLYAVCILLALVIVTGIVRAIQAALNSQALTRRLDRILEILERIEGD